jgi:hypothetical protein
MRNPFMLHIQLMICTFYLGYKNKQSPAFIYKYLHLYSIVFIIVRCRRAKSFGFCSFSDFGISDKGYSTCITMTAFVTKVTNASIVPMVTKVTIDFLVIIFTLATKFTNGPMVTVTTMLTKFTNVQWLLRSGECARSV